MRDRWQDQYTDFLAGAFADILYGAGTGIVKVPPLGPDYPDYCYNCGKSLKNAPIYGNGLCAKCYFDAEAELPHPLYDR